MYGVGMSDTPEEEVPMPPEDFGKEWEDSEFHIAVDDIEDEETA